MNEKTKIYAVVGPTASGKSALALELAKRHGGEIISCDSMQIYKRMNIGTAKPTREEQGYCRLCSKRKNADSLRRYGTLSRYAFARR